MLTNERAYSAQLAMLNGQTDFERLAGSSPQARGLASNDEPTKAEKDHSRFEIRNTRFEIRDSRFEIRDSISKLTNQIKDLKICILATSNCSK